MIRSQRILWIDASAGAAGDMLLGALVDLGAPLAAIRRSLTSLPIAGWSVRSRAVTRGGVAARHVVVAVRGDTNDAAHAVRADHGTNWRRLRAILDGGDLSASVRNRAAEIFRRLFEAEAHAHGLPLGSVHLHEAGAVDAIVDVVGVCAALEHLRPEHIVVSPLTTGVGTVACAHGNLPVPGPATTWMIRGVPLSGIEAGGERLTPTGAAILTTLADDWGGLPAMIPKSIGHGAGTRDFADRPNLVRAVLGEARAASRQNGEVVVVECTLDDATPQSIAFASESLFDAGALEVFTTAAHMKKGRSGHLITVLATPDRFEAVADVLLRETTTLGLRYRRESRIELERTVHATTTPHGRVRVKSALLDGREVHAWPEYEDCAALARRRRVPILDVQLAALEAHRAERRRARGAARASRTPARKGTR